MKLFLSVITIDMSEYLPTSIMESTCTILGNNSLISFRNHSHITGIYEFELYLALMSRYTFDNLERTLRTRVITQINGCSKNTRNVAVLYGFLMV